MARPATGSRSPRLSEGSHGRVEGSRARHRIPGAIYEGDGRCRFTVWAPLHERMEIRLLPPDGRRVALDRVEGGFHTALVDRVAPGALYVLRLADGREIPDPASRRQPRGVHGPSCVVDPSFDWSGAGFPEVRLADLVLYEIHVGAFTPEGTFDAIAPRLGSLRDLGVTAIELMPVASFPGERNWGYDGVYPFSVQESYGGPDGLRRLVDACHGTGMAVVLDVVHNHLGPDGNYLPVLAPCFTDRHATPWGAALDFDGPGSRPVRDFFVESALWLFSALRVDGFRVDAIHAIRDASSPPFLRELTERVHERARLEGRTVLVIAESDENDPAAVIPSTEGGLGFDTQWSEDFHHAVHAFLTGERAGYYRDFGSLDMGARAFETPHVYEGQTSSWRGAPRGRPARGLPPERFVVYTQNHDQVGNRPRGDRLASALDLRDQRLLAALLLTAPWTPLLFMGQEYGETAPFPYFTSHEDPGLAEAVRRGRLREFEGFGWPAAEVPDPQALETFLSAKVRWERAEEPAARALRDLHRDLIRLRREVPLLSAPRLDAQRVAVVAGGEILTLHRTGLRPEGQQITVVADGEVLALHRTAPEREGCPREAAVEERDGAVDPDRSLIDDGDPSHTRSASGPGRPGPAPPPRSASRSGREQGLFAIFSFEREEAPRSVEAPPGPWVRLLDTEEIRWGGGGSAIPVRIGEGDPRGVHVCARSCVLLARDGGAGA